MIDGREKRWKRCEAMYEARVVDGGRVGVEVWGRLQVG